MRFAVFYIDNLVNMHQEKILLKTNIEGAEEGALLGAKEHIQKTCKIALTGPSIILFFFCFRFHLFYTSLNMHRKISQLVLMQFRV